MNFLRRYTLALLIVPLLWACEDFNEHSLDPVIAGNANFSKYVAVGNSLAAGFQNNALYPEGQAYSYPALIARQMLVPEFAQPQIGDGYGTRLEIESFTSTGAVTTSTILVPGSPTQPTGGYQNTGIPGAVLADYLDADGAFSARFAASPAYVFAISTSPSISSYFNSQNATFATFWLGNNDILGYVTSGGLRPFTDPNNYGAWYAAAIADMFTNNSNLSGVAVGNVPGVTSIAFTTYTGPQFLAAIASNDAIPGLIVQKTFYQANAAINAAENKAPYAFIPKANLDKPSQGALLLTFQQVSNLLGTSAYSGAPTYDATKVAMILGYWRSFLVSAGVVPNQATADAMSQSDLETTLTNVTYGQYAQTFSVTPQVAATELGGYSFDFTKPFGLDAQNPLPNQFFLDQNEINIANAVTTIYNGIISSVAASNSKVALVNINKIFGDIVAAGGTIQDGIALAPTLLSLFSLDGVHPTNRGYALLANEFIKSINTAFGAEIPRINLNTIPVGLPLNAGAN